MRTLSLAACGCTFTIECGDDQTAALVTAAFGGLMAPAIPAAGTPADLLSIDVSGRMCVGGDNPSPVFFADPFDFLLYLDKYLILALQHRRPDLYFLHAAAVARDDRVVVLPAPSGAGKSTLTLALIQRRLHLLSDELAPIDARAGRVYPYARAICLKSAPPSPYTVPRGTIETDGRMFVPTTDGSACRGNANRMAALVFLSRRQSAREICRPIAPARGAALLMSNALNSAAHERYGLDLAATLAERVPCFELDSSNLDAACAAVEAILQRLARKDLQNVGL